MLLTCHYYSNAIGSNIEITVIIPTPEGSEQVTNLKTAVQYDYDNGLPVVYLLHGAYGDDMSWVRFSNVERYAQAHRLVAVMAGVKNSFYQDMPHGEAYHTFIAEELPSYIQALFPVSSKREDTYLAGLSMGGYGTWYIGLSHPENYAKIASMSAAIDIAALYRSSADGPFRWADTFEDPEHLEGSDRDIFELYRRAAGKGVIPELYMSCGTADFLYEMNRQARDRLTAMGAQITWSETPGAMHDWNFWDGEINRIFDWMVGKPETV